MEAHRLEAYRDATPMPERTCKCCGRPVYKEPGKRGPTPAYCRPQPGEERSKCATLAKRADEIRRLAQALIDECVASGADIAQVQATAQSLKAFTWSELNCATNILGKLAKKQAARDVTGGAK